MVNFTTNEIDALLNEQFDPENIQFLVETSLNQPLSARVVIYNLLDGNRNIMGT